MYVCYRVLKRGRELGNSGSSVPFFLPDAFSLSLCVLLMGIQLVLATTTGNAQSAGQDVMVLYSRAQLLGLAFYELKNGTVDMTPSVLYYPAYIPHNCARRRREKR